MDELIVPHSEPSIVPTHWHPLPDLPLLDVPIGTAR